MKIKLKKNNKKVNRKQNILEHKAYAAETYTAIQKDFYEDTGREQSPFALRNNVVSYCEQLMEVSKDLEDCRAEYQLLSSYLNDVQLYESLKKPDRIPIEDTANHILALNRARDEFLKADQRLSESQFSLMQENEDDMPSIIKRMEENENYLNSIKNDMHSLEGEKMEWHIEEEECQREQKLLRTMSLLLLILVASVVLGLTLLGYVMEEDLKLAIIATLFLGALMATYLLFKYQDSMKALQQCGVNQNHAITLENRAKIKYVNIKNAVDYAYEKYHVMNSKQLTYIYEQYQEALKEQERFQQMNEDLNYYEELLEQQLKTFWLKEGSGWANYALALVDGNEMVNLKHDLIARRKKLRRRMEYNIDTIDHMKENIRRNLQYMGDERPQIEEILKKIEVITQKIM